jgi:hypothetical protein
MWDEDFGTDFFSVQALEQGIAKEDVENTT